MYIYKPEENTQNTAQICEALQLFIDQPTPKDLAPCLNCDNHIPADCSVKCSDAPAALSSDPMNHPLESKVVPLVFELTSTRLMQPCWSCEGHFNNENELWKLPQISFYSRSPVYPQLVVRHIQDLKVQKKLAYEWHVVLSDFGQSWNMSYSIEPRLNDVKEPRLGMLQQDLQSISEDMCNKLKSIAKKMMFELNP